MRTVSSIKNAIASFASLGGVFVLTFYTRKLFAQELGSEYFGLNVYIVSALVVVSLADLGLSQAASYVLYAPLRRGDQLVTASLLAYFRRIYRWVALAVLALGMVSAPVFYGLSQTSASGFLFFSVYAVYLANSAVSYLAAHSRSFLFASQRAYVATYIDFGFRLLSLAAQALILTTEYRPEIKFVAFAVALTIGTVASNLFVLRYAKTRLPRTFTPSPPLAPEWLTLVRTKITGIIFHKIGDLCLNYADYLVVTVFLGLAQAGYLSNYMLLASTAAIFALKLFEAATAGYGEMIAGPDRSRVKKVFETSNFIQIVIATNAALLIVGFSTALIGLVFGSSYALTEQFAVLLGFSLFLQMLRMPLGAVKNAGGIFEQDKYIPLIEAAVNLIVSLICVRLFGLNGVLIAKIAASVILSNWIRAYFVYGIIFDLPIAAYLKLTAWQVARVALPAAIGSCFVFWLDQRSTGWAGLLSGVAVTLLAANACILAVNFQSPEIRHALSLLIRRKTP